MIPRWRCSNKTKWESRSFIRILLGQSSIRLSYNYVAKWTQIVMRTARQCYEMNVCIIIIRDGPPESWECGGGEDRMKYRQIRHVLHWHAYIASTTFILSGKLRQVNREGKFLCLFVGEISICREITQHDNRSPNSCFNGLLWWLFCGKCVHQR